jgi:hypothetical protein
MIVVLYQLQVEHHRRTLLVFWLTIKQQQQVALIIWHLNCFSTVKKLLPEQIC